MANTTETATFNVKSNIGDVSKDAAGAAGQFKVMGVSLNGVKAAFSSVGKTAKLMFGSIKAGLISTGIGAFVVLIGSLVSYFTNTKRGADKLAQAFSAIGAVVSVLTDRLSKIGEALSFVFSGDFQKAGEAMKGTFSGIADEVEREVKAMVELKKRTQELRDADMDFMVQKAQTRQEIEKARLIAEDETKSAKERLDNLKKALELEAETTQKEIELAKERMLIQKEEMALSENLEEDEQKLAELKAAIIEKETASIKMRRRVVTEVNALEREIAAEEKARSKEKQDRIDADLKKKQDAIDAEMKKIQELRDLEQQRINDLTVTGAELLDKYYESQLTAQERETNAVYDKYFAIIEGKRALNEDVTELEKAQAAEIDAIQQKSADKQIALDNAVKDAKTDSAKQGLKLIESVAGEGSVVGKAAAIAQATISGVQSVQNAFTTAAASPITAGFPAYPYIQAGLAGAFSAVQLAKIKSGGEGGGSGGGGSAPATPAPQMMSGQFELGGGIAPEPVKAFVVTDEMTNSQDQLANIRRRATI